MPPHVDRRFPMSFGLNSSGSEFSDRNRAEVIRPHLSNRLGVSTAERTRELPADAPFDRTAAPLTAREREVLDWVAAGKTNRDIAAILGASPRTIEKHLERVYEKLGVETRTAAVMRVCGAGYPTVSLPGWQALFGPPALSGNVADGVSSEFRAALKDPRVRAKLNQALLEPRGSSPAELSNTIAKDVEAWRRFIRDHRIPQE